MDIFIEPSKNRSGFRALRNKQVIAVADTQEECAKKAHKAYPDDTIMAARVRFTDYGNPDHWRRLYV